MALGDLYPFVQSSPGPLFALLEGLAALDETVVREQATETLNTLAKNLPDSEISAFFVPIVLKLAAAENFSARISACGLFASAYPRAGNNKERLRSKFLELSHEETPMVRRAAVAQMRNFAKVLEKSYLVSDFIHDLKNLLQDEQEQVRTLCIDSLIDVAKLLSKEENKLHTLPLILFIGEDKSWKVRYHFGQKFPQVAESLGREITESSLIQTLVQLLQDPESDVKSVSLTSLHSTFQFISRDRVQALVFPAIESIISDNSLPPKVRKNCAAVLPDLSSTLGKEFTSLRILPIVHQLLSDEHIEVKLSMIQGLGQLVTTAGSEMVSTELVGLLEGIGKDPSQWRLRAAVIRACVDICKVLGDEIFIRSLQDIYFGFLNDPVSEVRLSGVETIADIVTVLGDEWVTAEFLPKLQDIYHRDNFVARINVLHALAKVRLSVDQMSTIFYFAAKDSVPNVRLVLCKVMKEIAGKMDISQLRK